MKLIQEDLQKAKGQAENANVAKTHFLANMSHEIRTPLGAILGFTELMVREKTTPEDRNRFAQTIKRNGDALMQIINDILDLSKIEAGKLQIEPEDVDLRKLIGDILHLFSVRAADRNVLLKFSIDIKIPQWIRADSTRLRQILFNVLGNAIKFTNGGEVTLSARLLQNEESGAECIQFQVTDTGIGIAPEHQSHLFQPFSQADNTTTRRFGGTGLGLMLSKRLAEAMQGQFFLLCSTPGKGSTFELRLPAEWAHATFAPSPVPIEPTAVTPGSIHGLRILLIEDNLDNLVLFERMLRQKGAIVSSAKNGKEGVELALKESFDLILSDIQMPVMDGLEAARTLRKAGFNKPMVSLTAHAFPEDAEKSKAAGFDAHLTKPVDPDKLTATLALVGLQNA